MSIGKLINSERDGGKWRKMKKDCTYILY